MLEIGDESLIVSDHSLAHLSSRHDLIVAESRCLSKDLFIFFFFFTIIFIHISPLYLINRIYFCT